MADNKTLTLAELMKKPIEEMTLEELQKYEVVSRIELTREQLEQLTAKRESRKRAHSEQEKTLREEREMQRVTQRNCSHRKGGKGDDLKTNRGSDPNYAMADQQMPNGQIWRMCTRCWAQWRPGDTAKTHPSGIAYEKAMDWPTDNTGSGSVQFRIPEKAAVAS